MLSNSFMKISLPIPIYSKSTSIGGATFEDNSVKFNSSRILKHQFRSNCFRSTGKLRNNSSFGAARSRSDNTFGKARFLGNISPNTIPVRFKVRGVLNRSDRVDVVRIDVEPGVNFLGGYSLRLRKGPIEATDYFLTPGSPLLEGTSQRFSPGRYSWRDEHQQGNSGNVTVQYYLRIHLPNNSNSASYDWTFLYY